MVSDMASVINIHATVIDQRTQGGVMYLGGIHEQPSLLCPPRAFSSPG